MVVFIPTSYQLEDLLNSNAIYAPDSGYNEALQGLAVPVVSATGEVTGYASPGIEAAPAVAARIQTVTGVDVYATPLYDSEDHMQLYVIGGLAVALYFLLRKHRKDKRGA